MELLRDSLPPPALGFGRPAEPIRGVALTDEELELALPTFGVVFPLAGLEVARVAARARCLTLLVVREMVVDPGVDDFLAEPKIEGSLEPLPGLCFALGACTVPCGGLTIPSLRKLLMEDRRPNAP